jgi:hypothetical protein
MRITNMSKNFVPPALDLMNQLADANGMVPVYHKTGLCTRWTNDGVRETLDPTSICHEYLVPAVSLQARLGTDAGGEFMHLAFPAQCGKWHNIVRAENGRLVMGDPKLPTWMY